MKTFIAISKNTGHKGQKKVRRWMVYFALNFNMILKYSIKNYPSAYFKAGVCIGAFLSGIITLLIGKI